MQPPFLHIENLTISFLGEEGKTEAVRNISLEINTGQIVALVGESGSGKSVTALSILQLLPTPPAEYSSGKILFTDGNKTFDILKMKAKELQKLRGNKVSMIFQEPMSSLNPVMKCGEQVMEALVQHKNISSTEAKKKDNRMAGKSKTSAAGKNILPLPTRT